MNKEPEVEKEESTIIASENIEKMLDNKWFINSGKVIAILTTVCTIAIFLVREYWYLYQWGYFYAIGIDRIYIDVEGMGVLFYVLGYLGVAGIMIASNYVYYILCVCKRKRFILVWALVETIFFWIIIFLLSKSNVLDALEEIINQGKGFDYLILIVKIMISIIFLNIAGIYYGLLGNIQQVKDKAENGIDLKVIWKKMIELLLIICVEGMVVFLIGVNVGYEKKDYKVIIKTLENVETVEDTYIFEWNSNDVSIYPVLYEDKDNFIISYLCRDEDKIYIESKHQMVIAKEDIETRYCENIFEIGKSISENSDDKINEEENGDKKMIDTIAAALIGAVFTGVCTWIIEIILRNCDERDKKSHAASILYYDLKSIQNYLQYEKGSVNIRYTTGWQEMISNCTFLSEQEIAYLFKIYDEVYNYNYQYTLKEKGTHAVVKEDIASYGALQKLFLINVESKRSKSSKNDNNVRDYSDVMAKLEKYLK